MTNTEILRGLEAPRFYAIFQESPKQVRELIFDRLHIQPKPLPKTKFPKPGAKAEAQMAALYAFLKEEDDEQVADELLRNYFLKRRALLASALDHLGVAHEDGLTNAELDQFEKLSNGDADKLFKAMASKNDPKDVELYLKYMKVPKYAA